MIQDSYAWLEPMKVIYHRDNKVWIYVDGNLQKVAMVKIKPQELIPRKGDKENKDHAEDVVGDEEKNGE